MGVSISKQEIDEIFDSMPKTPTISKADIDAVFDAPSTPTKKRGYDPENDRNLSQWVTLTPSVKNERKEPIRGMENAKAFGRQALENAKRELGQTIPYLKEEKEETGGNARRPQNDTGVYDYVPTRDEYNQFTDAVNQYTQRQVIQDQNRSRNAERRREQAKDTGVAPILGSRLPANGQEEITEAGKAEIAELTKQKEKLQKEIETFTTGDVGVDEANQSRNREKINEINGQIEKIKQDKHASTEDWLVPRNEYETYLRDPEFKADLEELDRIDIGGAMGTSMAPLKTKEGAYPEQMYPDKFVKFLANKYGLSKKEIKDIEKTYRADKMSGIVADYNEDVQKYGEEHPLVGTGLSVLSSIPNAIEGAYNVGSGLITNDTRNTSRIFDTTKTGLREGVKEDIDTNGGKIAYDVLSGLGDLGIGVLTGNAPLMLAGNTANSAYLTAEDRGQSARKAGLYGGASGVVDYITNTIGLDKAKALGMQTFAGDGAKAILGRLGVAAGTEAGENVLQNISQTFLDQMINGSRSDLQTAYADYLDSGMTADQAYKATFNDWLGSLGSDALMGAAMGAAMYGGSVGAKNAIPKVKQGLADLRERFNGGREKIPTLDPEEMARQNEIDAEEVAERQNQVAEEIQTLTEQLPEISLDPEKVYGWSDAADRLIPQDSYARSEEYRNLQKQRRELYNAKKDLEKANTSLREELKTESSIKPKEEWDTNDEIIALLGDKPQSYTARGEEINNEIKNNREKIKELESRISDLDDNEYYTLANERLAQLEKYMANDIMPATRSDYDGFSTDTGTSMYNDYVKEGKAIVAEMSPEEYIRRCAYEIFHYDGHATLESVMGTRSQKVISELMDEIRKGTKLDAPYLDYIDDGQEGLHRALAAYALGIEKIPVVVRGTPQDAEALGFEARNLKSEIDTRRLEKENERLSAELGEMDPEDYLDAEDLEKLSSTEPEPQQMSLDDLTRADTETEKELPNRIPKVDMPVETAGGNGADVPPYNGNIIPKVGEVGPKRGKVSQYATNTMRYGTYITPEDYQKHVNLSDFMYEDKSEIQSMADAFRMIEEEGVDNIKKRLLSDKAERLTQSEIDALMSIVRTNNATARAIEAEGGNADSIWEETNRINKKLRQQSTGNAQALQALAKWTRNTPEGMLMHAENIISGNTKTEKSPLQNILDKLAKMKKDIDFSADFEKRFIAEAEKLQDIADMDSREAKDIMARLGRMINDEIPVKLSEKVTAYLMDNMLGNFRTLITRNAGGNLGLNIMEQTMTRPLAAGIDRLVAKKTGKRTQAGMSIPALKEYIQGFAKGLSDEAHDVKTGLHTARTGENTLENAIRSNRHVFKSKIGDKLDSLVKNGLSVGDRPFYEATYKQTLGDYYRLREQGVMGKVIQDLPDEAFKEYAEAAAKLNALAAVYQNDSTISTSLLELKEGIGDLSKGILGFDILSQFSMPFVKTPANVVDRAIDYSPLGLVRNAVRTAREGGISGENFDQNRFVNETARNILGSALMGGGAAAAAKGIMSGSYSEDKDERKAQKESGMQEYALNMPGNMQMDIGWAPVVGSNLVAAAAAYDAYKKANDENGMQAVIKGLAEGGQALFDQSMFQGLQRLFGTGESYNSDDNIVSNMMNVVKQGFGQAIPSLVRQGAQVTDKYQRDLSGSNQGVSFGPFDSYTLNSWANNVPYLRENVLNPKVDSEGNFIEESQGRGLGSRILEDMFLPGKITQITSNPLNDEAMRLSEITGNATSYMPKPSRSKVDTEDHTLTNEEYLEYEQRYSKDMTEAGETMLKQPLYQTADDQTKESMLNNLYSAVSTAINSEYNGKELSGAAKEYSENGLDAAIDYVQYGGILNKYGLQNNEKNREMVKEGGIEAVENAAQAKELKDEAGVTGSSNIGKMITEAVENGNDEEAQAMVDSTVALKNMGLEKPGPAATYVKAKEIYGDDYSVEKFADTYKKIDADHNQGIKQKEILSYLVDNKIPKVEGDKIVKVYGGNWKKIPVYEGGTWTLK